MNQDQYLDYEKQKLEALQEEQRLIELQPKPLTEVGEDYKHFIELKNNAPSTGYPVLDEMIGGLIPTSTITLIGNTSAGKTSFACNLSMSVCNRGGKVLYFALEPRFRIVSSIATIGMDFDYNDVDVRFDEVTDYLEKLSNFHYFDKNGFKSIDQVITKIEMLDRYDLIVVDHMGYFTNDEENVIALESKVINKLAEVAYTKESTILNIVHTNKEAIDKPVLGLKDVKGSSSIFQDSTDFLAITRTESSLDGVVSVLKTKNAKTGVMRVKFSDFSASIKQVNDIKYPLSAATRLMLMTKIEDYIYYMKKVIHDSDKAITLNLLKAHLENAGFRDKDIFYYAINEAIDQEYIVREVKSGTASSDIYKNKNKFERKSI